MMPLLASLLVAAQALTLPAPSARPCTAIDVVDPAQESGRKTRVFSAAQTVDLQLRVRLRPRFSGDHVLRLKLFTPGGSLYQELTIPFSPDSASLRRERNGRDEATRFAPGFPRALDLEKTKHVPKGKRGFDQATARLAVAGTSITLGSLFGRWTVVPFLDEETARCGPSRQFEIRR
jgi:hypothetical protein